MSGVYSGGLCRGEMSGQGKRPEEIPDPMQDYKPLRVAVMICATMVNTQTHTDTQLLTSCTISSARQAKTCNSNIETLMLECYGGNHRWQS